MGMRLTMIFLGIVISAQIFADDIYIEPITDQITKDECSACHFAFPAAMLPQASWKKILRDLENHFGEDASLDAQTTQHIKEYLVARSGDAGFLPSKFVRGLDIDNPPVRITETNYWISKHIHIAHEKLQSGLAGLKAVCTVCHRRVENGFYDLD